jgi:hypothetical protein
LNEKQKQRFNRIEDFMSQQAIMLSAGADARSDQATKEANANLAVIRDLERELSTYVDEAEKEGFTHFMIDNVSKLINEIITTQQAIMKVADNVNRNEQEYVIQQIRVNSKVMQALLNRSFIEFYYKLNYSKSLKLMKVYAAILKSQSDFYKGEVERGEYINTMYSHDLRTTVLTINSSKMSSIWFYALSPELLDLNALSNNKENSFHKTISIFFAIDYDKISSDYNDNQLKFLMTVLNSSPALQSYTRQASHDGPNGFSKVFLNAYVDRIKVARHGGSLGGVFFDIFKDIYNDSVNSDAKHNLMSNMRSANERLLPPGWKFVELLQSDVDQCAAVFDQCARPESDCVKRTVNWNNLVCPRAKEFFNN